METRFLSTGGWHVAYWDNEHPGPSLFFVHGNSSSKGSFRGQFRDPLSECYRLIAIDLPGHGESTQISDDAGGYSIEMLASLLPLAAEALNAEESLFIGHSLGGHLLLQAAIGLTGAWGIVLFGTPPLTNPPNFEDAFLPSPIGQAFLQADLTSEQVETWAQASVAPGTDPPPLIAEDIRRSDPQVRSGLAHSLMNLTYRDEQEVLAGLQVPVVILHGAEDRFINLEYLQNLSPSALWQGGPRVIEEAGHFPQLERPEMFNERLRAFARETTPV